MVVMVLFYREKHGGVMFDLGKNMTWNQLEVNHFTDPCGVPTQITVPVDAFLFG